MIFPETDRGQPLSPCCNAIMFATYKQNPIQGHGRTIDYIYCSKCLCKLDLNGIKIQPIQHHKP